MASAVVIESPVAQMGKFNPQAFGLERFVSSAVVNVRSGDTRIKTGTFTDSPDEIKAIAGILNSGVYHGEVKEIVLGGVTYEVDQQDSKSLTAENGDGGIVAREVADGDWIIGVYDKNITKVQALQ